MGIKLLGVLFVIFGCGAVGFTMASVHRFEENMLRQLIGIMDFMECELQYHLTPLPTLCARAAEEGTGPMRTVFLKLSAELENQIQPNAEICMKNTLCAVDNIPASTNEALLLLGRSLGRFDIAGQLKGLDGVRQHCNRVLETLCTDKEIRLRNYKTLGLCAGAAMAILFI